MLGWIFFALVIAALVAVSFFNDGTMQQLPLSDQNAYRCRWALLVLLIYTFQWAVFERQVPFYEHLIAIVIAILVYLVADKLPFAPSFWTLRLPPSEGLAYEKALKHGERISVIAENGGYWIGNLDDIIKRPEFYIVSLAPRRGGFQVSGDAAALRHYLDCRHVELQPTQGPKGQTWFEFVAAQPKKSVSLLVFWQEN